MTSRDAANTLSKLDVGTFAAWQAAGLTRRQLYTLVKSGQLVRVRQGAYATSSVLARAETDPGLRHALDVAATMALLAQPPGETVTLTVPPGTRAGRYRAELLGLAR